MQLAMEGNAALLKATPWYSQSQSNGIGFNFPSATLVSDTRIIAVMVA